MKNEYKTVGDTTLIYLPTGEECILDTKDFCSIVHMDVTWRLQRGKRTSYAAGRYKGEKIYMHRLLTGLNKGDKRVVDHRNRNGLDNTRGNMVVCTASDNNRNRNKQKNNTSGYRGVYPTPNGKWKAVIYVGDKYQHLGTYDCPIKAARVVNEYRREFGMAIDRIPITNS